MLTGILAGLACLLGLFVGRFTMKVQIRAKLLQRHTRLSHALRYARKNHVDEEPIRWAANSLEDLLCRIDKDLRI